jgi:mannose-6-phosphate isomerase-like protein (cupin superfamily)
MAVTKGEGYAVAQLDDLGEGWGFRKVRKELDVTAFGVNAIVLPPQYETNFHYHDEQEELYILLSGEVEIVFGDGTEHRLQPGGMARVAPETHRKLRNVSDGDSTYVCVGGKDGYVGRDGRDPEGATSAGPPGGA